MGKIISINNQEIGYYQNGEVKNTRGEVLAYYNESNGDIYRLSSVANNYFAVYQYGKIYRKKGFSQTKVGNIISGKDWGGHDGKIVDNSGNTVAFYEGEDCIGLGAAAAALVFHLYESNSSNPSDSSDSSGGSQPSDQPNIFEVIIGLIGAVIIFIVKAVKFVVTSLSKPKAMMAFIIGSWGLDIILRIMSCITKKDGFIESIIYVPIISMMFAIGLFTAIKLNKCKKEQTLKKRTVGLLTVVASPAWLVYFLNSVCYLYGRVSALLQGLDYYSGEYEFPFFIEAFFVLQGNFSNYDPELFPSSLSSLRDITYFIGYRFQLMPRVNFLDHYISNDMFFALIFSILVLIVLASHNRKLKKQQKAQSVNENSTT